MNARLALASALLVAVALAGCNRQQQRAEQAAAQAAATEDAAKRGESAFDDAVAKANWPLAKAQADVLMQNYPQSQAAARVRAQYDDVKARAEAEREQARTAALWTYNRVAVAGKGKAGGTQLSASIYAKDDVDVDGSGAKPVQLIFRDHPAWGRSAYLVLQAGDFNCYGGCKLKVRVDDAPAKTMAGSRPKTDEAIAMFIEDERRLWRMTKDAKQLSIEFPVKAGGTRTAVFEVGGLDRSQMPGWD
ncbi:MAG TPA: hypothetical protein VHL61_00370 [Luteimonas sp.]|nr:hypothetical protein [Luteimonas sp.]